MSLLVSDVYQLLLDELRTDRRGLSVEIEEFNRLLRVVNQEIFDQYLTDFEINQSNADSMGWFKVHNFGIDLTLGVGTLPTNYYRLIGKPRILDGVTYRKVDLVTTYELACREDDYLTQPTVLHPVATIGGINALEQTQIRVVPTTVTKVWVDYIRMLDIPFLDYYINDTTYVKTFLPDSTTLQNIPAGYTYRTGTIGGAAVTVASQTRDLVWDDGDLSLIITKLVNRVAKALPDPLLLQTSAAEQIKSEE